VIAPPDSGRLGPGEKGKGTGSKTKPMAGCGVHASQEGGLDVPAEGVTANDWAFSMSYRAQPQSVAKARVAVARFATRAGVSEATLEKVKLAVSEAMTNVVVHAYTASDGLGEIHVDAAVEGGELIVGVADSGPGLRPRAESPGLGLGLAIIGELADKVEILQRDNGGLRVLMRFALTAPRPASDTAR
jgi:serine/threonine-protein kinase RsbW